MHWVFTVLLCGLLLIYMLAVLRDDVKQGKVQHRFYLLEKHKKYEYATRQDQPLEYWITVMIHILWASFFGWVLVSKLLA